MGRIMLLASALVAVLATPTVLAATPKPCVGASARAAGQSCDARASRFKASPAPDLAPILPNWPCRPIKPSTPSACSFGRRKAPAATVALVGDSHAPAWRAALASVVARKRWRGVTLYRSSCPFSLARQAETVERQRACQPWVRQTISWFQLHPEIETAFVTASAYYSMAPQPGLSAWETAVRGFRDAFAALPSTVKQIIVIRDTPRADVGTLDCITGALRNHRRPDLRCAVPRERALLADPAVEAASGRTHSIDLTDLFCDPTNCFTVIGGLIVHKDASHLSTRFSRSLGRFLQADFDQLIGSARQRSL